MLKHASWLILGGFNSGDPGDAVSFFFSWLLSWILKSLIWDFASNQSCHAIRYLTVMPAVNGLSCILVLERIPLLAVMPSLDKLSSHQLRTFMLSSASSLKLIILIFLGDLLLVEGLLVLCLSWNSAIYQNCHAIRNLTVKPAVYGLSCILVLKRIPLLAVMPSLDKLSSHQLRTFILSSSSWKLIILIFLGDLLLVWGLLVLCLSWNSAIYQNCHAIRNLTVKPAVYGLSCILLLKRIPFLAVMPAVKQTIKLSDTNYHAIGSYD